MNLLPLMLFVFNLTIVICHGQLGLDSVREWNQLDFNFPNPRTRADAIQKGRFVQRSCFPLDVDVDYRVSLDKSRVFVTIPRFTEGVPVTLGYVKSPKTDLLIQPYPDYSWHSSHGADCDKITSVLRVAIDSCNQLWVLDTGVVAGVKKCPPQLLVFNLVNDKLVKRYKFPPSQHTDLSLFVTPVLDVKDPATCLNTKVYIADVTSFALIVYDAVTNKSWKVQNKLFYPYPNFGTFTIAGESFDLMDGLLGMAISPSKSNEDNALSGSLSRLNERSLFFHSLASGNENVVPLRIINNASIWERDANSQPRAFKTIGTRGIQAAAQAMDTNGNLFFVTMDPLALVCWDSTTPYSTENIKIVYRNDATLQFASGVKVVKNLFGKEELWLLTMRFQKISSGSLNADEVNYRIQVKSISELLRGGTRCNGQQLGGGFVFPRLSESDASK